MFLKRLFEVSLTFLCFPNIPPPQACRDSQAQTHRTVFGVCIKCFLLLFFSICLQPFPNVSPPQACRDFLALAQAHSKRWQKALHSERDQRIRLEETLEQLAKQHNHLERAFRGATVLPLSQSNPTLDSKSKASPLTSNDLLH